MRKNNGYAIAIKLNANHRHMAFTETVLFSSFSRQSGSQWASPNHDTLVFNTKKEAKSFSDYYRLYNLGEITLITL